jgi:hypothetical protein
MNIARRLMSAFLSLSSSVSRRQGVVTGIGAGRSGHRIPEGRRDFSVLKNVQLGCGALSLRVKRTGREADRSS